MTAKNATQFTEQEHRLLAVWAADCAEHVLPYFEAIYPEDDRPRKAIQAVHLWERGDLAMVEARKAAFAARTAGHATATTHVAGHARHAAAYAVKAAEFNGDAASVDRDWQGNRLPDRLRPLVFPASRD
jgi:hypothetical protein